MSNSTDLVGRINSRVHDGPMDHEHMLDEAAAEIERLTKERDTWDRRVAYDELKARETENRATQQKQIDEMAARALASESKLREIEAETREAVAAFLAREYPDNANTNAFCAAIRASQGEKK